MSLVRKNIIANLIGSGWMALMSFIFIPFYIHFMGIEAYGLVGFYMTLQASFFLLDLGLTATVSRELARLSIEESPSDRMRTLVRTLEIVYWAISGTILFVVIILSERVATKWLQAETLSIDQIKSAVILMGFVIAARMLLGFYSGALVGLQRQVSMNVIKASMETLRNGGAVLVLWLISSDIMAFFFWQAGVSIISAYMMAIALWKRMPKSWVKPSFSKAALLRLWRFTAAMGGISFVSILLIQMDKIILSRILPLEVFGYYTLAAVVAMSLYFFIGPIVTAYAPRFTQLVAAGNQKELVILYHQGCQLMSVIIFPIAITIALFSFEVLLFWTQDEVIAEHAYQVLSILIIGTVLNGVMNFPYALQIAYAWTKLTLFLNLILLLLLFPLLIIMTQQFGIIGAALVWLLLNVIYVLVGIQLMHQRLLCDEKWKWYFQDFLLPFFSVLLVVGLGRFIVMGIDSPILIFFSLMIVILFAFFGAVIAAPLVRERFFSVIKRRYLS